MRNLPITTVLLSACLLFHPSAAEAQEQQPATPPAAPAAADPPPAPDKATVASSIGTDGTGSIIVEARGELPKPPVFYSSEIAATARLGAERIDYDVTIDVHIVQGEAANLSFLTHGLDEVTAVDGKSLESWAVRWEDKKRYLDIRLKPGQEPGSDHQFKVKLRSEKLKLPSSVQITNFGPGEGSTSLNQVVTLVIADEVDAKVKDTRGFLPVDAPGDSQPNRFQSSIGGLLAVQVDRSGSLPAAVEMSAVRLAGKVAEDGRSADFQLTGTARVNEAGAELAVLSGNAAISVLPASADYELVLSGQSKAPFFRLKFPEAGEFPINLTFVAGLAKVTGGETAMDFTVASSAVVPIVLSGLGEKVEFQQQADSIVPSRRGADWIGFVPATGRARMLWKSSRKVGEGRLFFSTSGRIETTVGAGLLRQHHHIDYKVLQGELPELVLDVDGAGEVLAVEGANIVAWTVSGAAGERKLTVSLSQAVTDTAQLQVRTQTPLDALPVRLQPMRLTPVGAVRHAGHLRVSNQGSVRLEPSDLSGLTQLAPEQFPAEALQARQIFVYRFPATDYALTITADRILPEVNVSELTVYRLTKTDRMISSDIELDIREAPIREWDIGVPEDYSVVKVTGAAVSDYVFGSEVENGQRVLKVLFGEEVTGRQLISLHLEKSETAAAGEWALPRLTFADAKSLRGDIGVVGEAGFRIVPGETELLVEKALSYFPKSMPGLQQAFRIREPEWSATMLIEVLEKSVQADVFHLYSLSERSAHGSVLLNYLVTGSPVSEWRITVPADVVNVGVEGRDVRTWRREGETLTVSLQQPVIGLYQLLVTFEEDLASDGTSVLRPGRVAPADVQSERGYLQVVSPVQVEIASETESDNLLQLDALELPAELRLLASAPPLGSWQYTERPFQLDLKVKWFDPGTTLQQVVDFSEVTTRITADGELVSEALYYVRSRGQRVLRLQLAEGERLWSVAVAGRTVSARSEIGQDQGILIPLPGTADPNLPIEVRLRVGRPAESKHHLKLRLPRPDAPTLKTDWRIIGDEKQALIPTGGTVAVPLTSEPISGFSWMSLHGVAALFQVLVLSLLGLGLSGSLRVFRRRPAAQDPSTRVPLWRLALGLIAFVAASAIAFSASGIYHPPGAGSLPLNTLRLSLPALSGGEAVTLALNTVSRWQVGISLYGLVVGLAGLAVVVKSFMPRGREHHDLWLVGGLVLFGLGVLAQGDSGPLAFRLLGAALLLLLFLPRLWRLLQGIRTQWKAHREQRRERRRRKAEAAVGAKGKKGKKGKAKPDGDDGNPGAAPAPSALWVLAGLLAFSLSGGALSSAQAQTLVPAGFSTADSAIQKWQIEHDEKRLHGVVKMQLSGAAGERFVLLGAPAVMTGFEGQGVRVSNQTVAGFGLAYVASITGAAGDYTVDFEFDLGGIDVAKGIAVPTGPAALQKLTVDIDQANWQIVSTAAVKNTPADGGDDQRSSAELLLAAGSRASIMLRPKPRDLSSETTQFFVEGTHLYLPGPGVVDGVHRIQVRPSQGQVSTLSLVVPEGLTVSDVNGPIASWQFDAEERTLQLAIEPAQSQAFTLNIGTQRGLDPLPADATLAPMQVEGAAGEVGLVALAFGPDAQPEKAESEDLSAINPGDFDASLLEGRQATLHRVFRYGAEGGDIDLRVAPVAPEIRVATKQVLSFGDERVVLAVNFSAEITRAGLFQLSFPLPDGFEVESLTGAALHHWSETASADGERQIVLHLNGKTIGNQTFALTLTGAAPGATDEWPVPRFEIIEANRQTGDLVVQSTTGIRLRSVTRQNVSEIDPRTLGGNSQGALAFRLLQRDWTLVLGVEQLDPRITAQVLHDVTLREGQTRTSLIADLTVSNASVRELKVRLPVGSDDEIRTLRASGNAVSDLVRTAPDSDIWELQFKRRIVGNVQVRIEYDRRDSRGSGSERLALAVFPDARQISYHFAVRAGGRLELGVGDLPRGWQLGDWTAVPQSLREAGSRNTPNLTLRALAPDEALEIEVRRHSLADALKLRIAKGVLTTVLSPKGDQVTAIDLTAEVIQPGSLTMTLPEGGELFSIFVNNESVHSIREGGEWKFHVLAGADERYASVRFVYSVPGDGLRRIALNSPPMNVPLENIAWNVIAPEGFELRDEDGDLQLNNVDEWQRFDRKSYLAKARQQRDDQAQLAASLLEQAGAYRQSGDQGKALWALNSVVNQGALDAATNEDARVQLENLQTQQAVVGLNTRRQRLYIDNAGDDAAAPSEQLMQGAAANPVLQEGHLNFRPQDYSQLMQGNTTEDNEVLRRIAVRMVEQQRSSEAAPQAISVTLPEEGRVYTFTRSVQVSEDAPLEMDLRFAAVDRLGFWRVTALLLLIAALAGALVAGGKFRREAAAAA